MTGRFVDTNVLLRHLLADDPNQSPRSSPLIDRIDGGEIEAWTTDLVIAEAVFVVSNPRTYNLSRVTIRDLLLPLIAMPALALPGKELYPRIFQLFTSLPIDFIDAYHAAHVEQRDVPEIYSFDQHLDRVPTVRRFEP